MKVKSAIFLAAVILCILFSGVSVYAADSNLDGYDDNDFNKIQAFLNQTSTNGTTSNGAFLNAAYNSADPTTWAGVTWNSDASKRVTAIDWYENYSLNGNLDASGFDALTSLQIGANSIDSLSVSGDTALTSLDASSNNLFSLNVTTLSSLTSLNVRSNSITSLDVSNNVLLTNLNCSVNRLTALNVASNTALTALDCRSNSIASLDLTGLNVLTSLTCSYNDLTALDLSTNVSLTTVIVTSNAISTLDVSGLSGLTTLECNSNSLSTLDVSANSALDSLSCSGNNLSSIDLTNNTALTYLLCSYNPFGSLSLTANTALQYLYANSCNLSSLDTTTNANLLHLYASDNSLSAVDVTGNSALTQLRISDNALTSISLTNNTSLEYLDLQNNNLTSLSTPASSSLSTVIASYNQLASINVGSSSAISTLTINNNLLTSIDVTSNTALRTLRANDNNLTAIDLSNCLLLDYAYLQNNDLTSLDVSLNTALDVVQALGNTLRSFEITASGTPVSVTARGLGTFGVLYNIAASTFYAVALPNATYDFENWTNSGGTVLSTNLTYTIVPSTAATIYANFTAGVIFDENGGDTPSNPAYSMAGPGELVTEPAVDPVYTGLTFTGWYTESDCITLWNFATDVVPASGLLTLYAGWAGNFTVTFNGSGGSPVPSDVTVAYKTTLTEPVTVPTRTGYDFGGWCSDAAGTIHWDFATDVVLHNMTLYADWNPQAFNVYFNENGGTSLPNPTSRVVYYGALVPYVTTEPELAGYVIEGWYTDLTYTNKWDFATDTVAGNMTLYVHWIAGDYTVTFSSPGATTPANPATMNFSYGDYVTPLPTAPTRSGYTFDAWYMEAGLINEVNFSTFQVTDDVTFYAGWTPNNYTVTFNRNGGDTDPVPTTMTVAYNTLIPSQPTAPTRTGYVFDAWCRDSAGVTAWNFATDRVLGNTTLYARWAQTYTVTFNNNGGTTQANPQTMVVVAGHVISPEPIAPTRTGYTFSGWYTTAAATTAWNFATNVVNANTTLYAGWTVNNYTVTFNNNGGDTAAVPATMSVPYNTLIPSQPTPPTRAGYLFEAWYKDSATTTLWNFSTDVVTRNTTLYAGYAEYYTVTFDENGGTVPASPTTVDVVENQTIGTTPTSPIWPGYQFNGWYTDAAATNAWDMDTDIVSSDMTLYAGWTSICTVTFDQNGGDTAAIPNNKQTLVGGTVTAPSVSPTRAGYTFSGWYTTSAAATLWNFSSPVNSSMTLYAGWTAVTYTVTFNENGGDSLAVPSTMQVAYGQLISPQPTAPARAGYVFSGWYTTAATTTGWDFSTDTVTGAMTLYAGWIQSHTVVFSSNGGDTAAIPSSMTVMTGELISPAPTAPTRVGYTFTGWYINSTATISFDLSTNAVTSDLILYAGWSANSYTVTFDENGGDTTAYPQTMTVHYGDLISPLPGEPTLTGYAFSGWFTNAAATTPWNFATGVVTGDVTLYAGYVPLVTVTFNSNGGDTEAVPSSVSVGVGLTIDTMPTPPTRTNYVFVGWYTDAALTTLWSPTVDTVTGAMTLYAGWTDVMHTVTFNPNGGTSTATVDTYSVAHGSLISVVPSNPTRSGYVFEGWYTDTSGTTAWNFATDTVTADTVLYAAWSAALSLSISPSSGDIYEDGRIEIIPNITGGTWYYDDTYLSASITTARAVFTGLRAGDTTVSYTADGQTIQFTITISDAELPSTGQSYTWLMILAGLTAAVAAALIWLTIAQNRTKKEQRV